MEDEEIKLNLKEKYEAWKKWNYLHPKLSLIIQILFLLLWALLVYYLYHYLNTDFADMCNKCLSNPCSFGNCNPFMK